MINWTVTRRKIAPLPTLLLDKPHEGFIKISLLIPDFPLQVLLQTVIATSTSVIYHSCNSLSIDLICSVYWPFCSVRHCFRHRIHSRKQHRQGPCYHSFLLLGETDNKKDKRNNFSDKSYKENRKYNREMW